MFPTHLGLLSLQPGCPQVEVDAHALLRNEERMECLRRDGAQAQGRSATTTTRNCEWSALPNWNGKICVLARSNLCVDRLDMV